MGLFDKIKTTAQSAVNSVTENQPVQQAQPVQPQQVSQEAQQVTQDPIQQTQPTVPQPIEQQSVSSVQSAELSQESASSQLVPQTNPQETQIQIHFGEKSIVVLVLVRRNQYSPIKFITFL